MSTQKRPQIKTTITQIATLSALVTVAAVLFGGVQIGTVSMSGSVPVTTGLVLHLDADAITGKSDTDSLDQWNDISGEGNHAETWSGVSNPVYRTDQMNGKPVVRYSGSEGLLVPHDTSLALSPEFTIFAVADLTATTSGVDNIRTILSKELSFSDRNYWLVQWDGDWVGRISESGTARQVESDEGAVTDPALISYRADGSNLNLFVDGEAQVLGDSYSSIDTQSAPVGIGRQADDARSWHGDIAEILIYNTALSDEDRESVEQYLGEKWLGWSSGSGGAMSSVNYSLERDSVNSGGVDGSVSTNYSLDDTVGEMATGVVSSENYEIHAGYRQMEEATIALSSPGNIDMGSLRGIVEDTADGSGAWIATTDSSGGYELSIRTSQTPAMQQVGGSADLSDYTPAGADPDFEFSIDSTTAAFGYSIEGDDTAERFRDNGSSCNTGSQVTADRCWDGLATSDAVIAASSGANHPDGTETTVKLRAMNGEDHLLPAATYEATIIITAVAL